MSEDLKSLQKEIERNAYVEAKQKVIRERQTYINDKRTEFELERLRQNESELKIAQGIDFGKLSDEEILKLRKNNIEYMNAAGARMYFINAAFNQAVPFFQKNLLLIGGKTGEGKSTTVANIVFSTISQANPHTKKPMRCLVITNEEKSEDVYNRITCQIRGWQYVNHDKFTAQQIAEFDRMIGILSADGMLTVVDNNYGGARGLTTSIEGIQSIFDNLIAKQEWYDVILIDYYQKVKYSKKQPDLDEWKVQALLADALDNYKNVYPAPIVLLAQVNPNKGEEEVPFEHRIKGRKVICDSATFIMEMVANRQEMKTDWIIHKSRFTENVGSSIETAFDRGRYIEMTDQFKKARAELQSRRLAEENDRAINAGEEKKQIEGTIDVQEPVK